MSNDIAACDGLYCPARDLCRRADAYDDPDGWQSYFLVPREEQCKGVGCKHFLANATGTPCAGGGS